MPNYTTNLNLAQPLDDEQYDVAVTRANNQKIDDFAGQVPARALTADKLTTGAKINGVTFKGDTDINIPVATNSDVGTVKPDGTTILVNENGVLSTTPYNTDFINNSKALLTGGVSDNATVYNQVRNYYHSTYDSTKFTITGSPTITADGILSNCSSGNYVQINSSTFDFENASSWQLGLSFKIDSTEETQMLFDSYANNISSVLRISFSVASGKKIVLLMRDTNGAAIFNSVGIIQSVETDKWYNITIRFTGTQYIVSDDTGVLSTVTNSNKIEVGSIIRLGLRADNGLPLNNGQIDLKSLSLTFDGNNIFNGNQIGTDTYKVAGSGTTINYTVVGTPTITSNVVSDFSAADYVTSDVNFNPGSSSFEIGTKITMPSYNSPILNIPAGGGSFYWLEFDSSTSNLHFDFGGTNYGEIEDVTYPSEGQPLWIKLNYDGTDFVLSMSTNGTTYPDSVTVTANNFVAPNAPINFGVADLMTTFFYGSIDMSQTYFKINGSVVWQGVTTVSDIQIKYNLSNTGSKIATAASRNDIAALYAQNGYAPYYTIDEANKTFTLPAGEIYGMINSAKRYCNVAPEYLYYGVSVVGSLTDNDGVLSGFSSSNYAKINHYFDPGSSSWVMVRKIHTGNDVTTTQYISSANNRDLGPAEFELKNGKFNFGLANDSISGTYDVQTDTDYLLRASYTGTQYVLEYSTNNGTTWNVDGTLTSSTPIQDFEPLIGIDQYQGAYSSPFLGTIDLNGCFDYIDDVEVWRGVANNIVPTPDMPAVVVDSYWNNGNFYMIYSNGWCEQGGWISASETTNKTINLLIAYKNKDYNIQVSKTGASTGSNNASWAIYNPTTTSFSYHQSDFYGTGCYWVARGYKA